MIERAPAVSLSVNSLIILSKHFHPLYDVLYLFVCLSLSLNYQSHQTVGAQCPVPRTLLSPESVGIWGGWEGLSQVILNMYRCHASLPTLALSKLLSWGTSLQPSPQIMRLAQC